MKQLGVRNYELGGLSTVKNCKISRKWQKVGFIRMGIVYLYPQSPSTASSLRYSHGCVTVSVVLVRDMQMRHQRTIQYPKTPNYTGINRRFTQILVIFFSVFLVNPPVSISLTFRNGDQNSGYIGICAGITNYFGDLRNNNMRGVSITNRFGGQIMLERDLLKPIRLCGGLFFGNIVGDELSAQRNLNFKTSITAPYVGVSVDLLNSVHAANSNGFSFWLFGGVEYFLFTPMGDIKDGSGKPYYYWSDGSIRTQTEIPGHTNSAVIIQRDYNYETDYRNMNIDNVSNYHKSALGFPVGLSIEKKFNDRTSFRIGGVYHYTLTDYLDNITANSVGSRKGNVGNDQYLFLYAGLLYSIPFGATSRCPVLR